MYIVQPIIITRLLWRSISIASYRKRWNERYGFYKAHIKPGGIILHSVSIGETLAAIPLIHGLKKKYPKINITLTSMTPAGTELAKLKLGNSINYGYLPYDLPGPMYRFINHIKPVLVIVLETEMWPNLIKILHNHHIPLIIANARLSPQSATGYKRIKQFITSIMQHITLIAAQNKEDGERFIELGLKKQQLKIIGNIKFDIIINKKLIQKSKILKNLWAPNRYVWIASSTHKGEELFLLKVHKQLLTIFPNLLMILVPRHQERFKKVSQITLKTGLNYITRSSGKIPSATTQVIVSDTIGELMLLYGVADLAFIGGSLIKHGGHNPLEAAIHAIPILTGPHIFNFHDIYHKMKHGKALITINNTLTLVNEICKLLRNKDYRFYYGNNAINVFKKNQGSLKQLLSLLDNYIKIN